MYVSSCVAVLVVLLAEICVQISDTSKTYHLVTQYDPTIYVHVFLRLVGYM